MSLLEKEAVETIKRIFRLCQSEPEYSGDCNDARRLDDCVAKINYITEEFLDRSDIVLYVREVK